MDFLSDYFDGLLMDMLRGAVSDYFTSIAHLTNNVQDTVLIDGTHQQKIMAQLTQHQHL